jgi:AcrR family transcriptional regulator
MPQNRMRQEPSQDRSRRSVDLILDAAAELFVELGYESVTTNAIASRSGVSIGSLYRYFSDKAAILQAWVERYLEQLRALYDRAFSGDVAYLPLRVILDRLIDPFVEFCAERPAYKRLFLESGSSKGVREAARELDSYSTERVLGVLRAVAPSADPRRLEIVGAICNSMVKGLIALASESEDPEYRWLLMSETKSAMERYLEPVIRADARE